MAAILVSGLTNIETTLKVEGFPLEYFPVRALFFGIQSAVSGVGYNLARAFSVLGDEVRYLSLIGPEGEDNARLVRLALEREHVPVAHVLPRLQATAQSVILYDDSGRRQIHSDLKDNQQAVFPAEHFLQAAEDADLLAMCNIQYNRALLPLARQTGIPVATDVHVLSDPYDSYNADFMNAANILFLSDERLPEAPETFARRLYDIYHNQIIVIGLGSQGALLYEGADGVNIRVPAVQPRPVVNTIGAGDALFSAFCHAYLKYHNSLRALRYAVVFAGYKVGETGAAAGFLSDAEVEALAKQSYAQW